MSTLGNTLALSVQSKREQLADLAMAIFMRDPPNDPKTLYETREHGSIKLASLGVASKAKGSKHEVRLCSIHCGGGADGCSLLLLHRHCMLPRELTDSATAVEVSNVWLMSALWTA